jgi:signal transduction histidine kinase
MVESLDHERTEYRANREERKRIARELYDDLNQRMALLSIELEQLSQKIPQNQSNSMRERLRLVGGEITIHSQRSQGAQITVTVSLARQGRTPANQLPDA